MRLVLHKRALVTQLLPSFKSQMLLAPALLCHKDTVFPALCLAWGILLAQSCCIDLIDLGISKVRCPPIRAQYLDGSRPMTGQHSG